MHASLAILIPLQYRTTLSAPQNASIISDPPASFKNEAINLPLPCFPPKYCIRVNLSFFSLHQLTHLRCRGITSCAGAKNLFCVFPHICRNLLWFYTEILFVLIFVNNAHCRTRISVVQNNPRLLLMATCVNRNADYACDKQ